MLAWYAQVKAVHVGAVLVSGAVFLVRGVLVQAGHERIAMAAHVRYTSYAIDTVLLAAGVLLVAMLPSALFANHWLTVKLVLLVVYIVLGVLALRRARTRRARAVAFGAALLAFVAMFGIARAHSPLGWLAIVSAG
ncbi:MAG: SirB2 family protein [Burkholderiales bacterium]|nr:SirB2 family protein [Burkholderiales bacterium]